MLAAAYLLAGALAFGPGLTAGFVSDVFWFLEIALTSTWTGMLWRFVPVGSFFYRPLFQLTLWAVQPIFGLEPLGYHLLAWLAHVASALMLAALALVVAGDRVAAAVAGLAFLWSIHAHEVVYDVAALHHALAGPLLLVGVLLWARGRRALSLLAAAVGLLVNELALLVLPILVWYELCFGAAPTLARRASQAVWPLVPHAALVAAYFALRLGVARADLPSEGATCLGLRCLAIAAAEYANRLVVRPESLLARAWSQRVMLALASAGSVATIIGLLRPWAWRRPRAAVFAAGWTVVAVAYVVAALFPYTSDRFLYVPDMGLALLVGCLAGEGVRAWPGAGLGQRLSAALALATLAAWIGVGALMLRDRGALWSSAGSEAARIVADIQAAAPDPPTNALFCVGSTPDMYRVTVAPGNTGPYVFRNAFDAALRIRYSRVDLRAGPDCAEPPYATVHIAEGRARVTPAATR